MASKVEKLQGQIAEARRQRSNDIARLQAELSAEVGKARKRKGSRDEGTAEPKDNS